MTWEIIRSASNPDKEPDRPKAPIKPLIATFSPVQEVEDAEKKTDNEIFKDIYKKEPLVRMCIDSLVKGCVSGGYFFRPKKLVDYKDLLVRRKIEYLDFLFSEISPDYNMNELFWDLYSDYFTYYDAYQEIGVSDKLTKSKLLKLLKSKTDIYDIPLMVSLFPIPAETIMPIVDEDGTVKYYEQKLTSTKKKKFPSNIIIHYRVPNPVKSTTGFSALKTLSDPVAVSLNLRNYNGKFFENNATPRLHLDLPKGGPEEVAAFMEKATQELKGKPHKNIVTGGGVTVKPINISNKDMEFSQLSSNIRDEIIGVMGLQPVILGQVETANRANSITQYAIFKSLSIKPSQKIVIDRVNREILVKRLGIRDVVMATKAIDNVDLMEQGKIDQTDLAWAIKHIDEIRAERGMEPSTWAKGKPYNPLASLQPLTTQPKPEEPEEE